MIALLAIFTDSVFAWIENHGKIRSQGQFLLPMVSLILLLCFWNDSTPENMINIATKPMTEQYFLSEMLAILIEEETDYQVTLTHGVGGGTSNIHPAMELGEFDLYPEYTGTGWNMVLKEEGFYSESNFSQLQEEYLSQFSMEWVGMYGFNNTFGIAVASDIAEKYQLKTYSDLQRVSSQLVFGAEYDFFGREDGFEELCQKYELSFQKTMDMDIGLKYQAINQGESDVMNIFTTDGQLSVSDVVVLIDDKEIYPSYLCGNVVRTEMLQQFPLLAPLLTSIKIDDLQMAEMNYQVESLGKNPQEVALTFLTTTGLIG